MDPLKYKRKEQPVKKQNRKKHTLAFIVLYFYMVLILFSLLTVATYTWFAISRTPRVSDMYLFINAASGLEISATPDAEEWKLQLDFRELVDVTTELKPATWSEKDQKFYAAEYGFDGRHTGRWHELSDSIHANRDDVYGYYVKTVFYLRTGQKTKLYLTPAVEVDEGLDGSGTYLIGTPVWDSEEILHSNGGQGAECAVRVGIRITPVDTQGQPIGDESVFFIYEPNSDMHLSGSTEYTVTPSIDETPSLVPEDRLILQTASTWTETNPVERNAVIKDLGEFTTSSDLWVLDRDEIIRVELYIWLEGQDIDCTNAIDRAQILASIQFAGDSSGQSGMDPIDPDEPAETVPTENPANPE